MGSYAVEPGDLQRSDGGLVTTANGSRAELAHLRAAAAHLLDSRWQGPAAAAFRLGWQHWDDGMSAMLDALDVMAAALGSSGAGYAAVDEAVRTALAGASA